MKRNSINISINNYPLFPYAIASVPICPHCGGIMKVLVNKDKVTMKCQSNPVKKLYNTFRKCSYRVDIKGGLNEKR